MSSSNKLETIRQDGEFILYRGLRKSLTDGSFCSVLVLAPASERPAPETLSRMEHEFSLQAELDPAWAVRPLGLTPHQGRSALLLEDPGGEPLEQLLGTPMELGLFLRLAVGIAAALGKVHRRGVIHKDIKPAHLLVDAATGQVWLTGFGIASRLPRERQALQPPETIAGTLAYMAPEQTGRMNRSIDSRSDLYALGVTLYEMLTGSLPFTATDPMEWVHCHIARQPVPPGERSKGIPGPVSAIVMKLLAKTAEERYQTAAGLERDLRRCLAQWEADRRIDTFPLGQRDSPDRLMIPEKLYGRDREIEKLLASFDRVIKGGTPELVLVAGYSGIGKSSVVNELHKVLVPPRGLFASGKFDQYKRDIPYSTLAQAFQSLTRRLLAKSEADLATWRAALLEALGPNGRLMIDLVPELKLVIGDQPPVPDLLPQDARKRFQLVFRRFIGVFARREHPLALFLDDLQWLDAATLDLLEDLLAPAGVRHLMLIGAYRDNEVTAAHPLMRKLEAIRSAGANVQEITLAPLAGEDVRQLIADALRCEPERAAPLAKLVHEKTAGNPFFLVQFLHTLAEDGWLAFDHENGRWSWDLDRILAKRYRDNVVDLMVGRLNRLPLDTQKALQQLACLGNIAPVQMLSFALGKSPEEVRADLWDAVRLELVEQLEGSYKFIHDRVQEAAYSLIPEGLRDEAHLRIGRRLAAHIPPEKREEAIFDIVNQYNRGVALITSRDEREQMAELNLLAGKRAKASTAYAAALKYLVAGAALLPGDSWERRHELIFALELHRAECEFLTGALGPAEERLNLLSPRAANTVERATITRLRLNVYTTLDQSERAVEVCLDYLAHLGVEWLPHPTQEQALGEYQRIWSWLDGRSIEDLIELPLMSDTAMLGTLDVLTEVVTPALFTDENLLSLVICRMVNLSLEHGNSDGSCFAYVFLGMIAGRHFNNYEAGFQFARLGYELVERHGLRRYQARTYMCFGNLVMPWTRHVRTGRDLVRRAFDAANKAGDLTFAAYSRNNLNTNLLAAGDPLAEAQREAEQGLDFAHKARFGLVIDIITAQLGLIRTLRGLTPTFGCFDDEQFDERRFESQLASQPDLALPECWYWIRKLQARVLAGDYRQAILASLKAQRLLWTSPSFFETAEFEFYSGLARAALCDCPVHEQHRQDFEALTAHRRKIEVWAANCPENFENRAALLAAEVARIEGRELDAERLYERAIRSAHENGFVHNEALANELAARFYGARGFETIAHAYLRNARYCYLRWGADGKVRQLDRLHPQLRTEDGAPSPTGTIHAPVEHLDLATVIKVSQTVSGETVLEELLDTLMRAAIEHAGAERALLILARDAEQRIAAEATTGGDTVVVHLRDEPAAPAALPESVLHYALRTREAVILDDAANQSPFAADSYILERQARSILALPLITQAKLVGALYLENNLAPGVFAPGRVLVLKLLASQAATALENARLYRDLAEREAKIRRLVDANIIGIFIWDSEGRILDANDAFLSMLGYGRGDLAAGRVSWTEITPPEWRERDARLVEQGKQEGRLRPYEKEYFRKDGSRVPVLIGAATFEEGGSQGVAFVLDLTDRKRAEQALRAREAAEAANRGKDEFLANVSHEIRTPMNAILGMAELALESSPSDHQRQLLSTVRTAAKNLLTIIDDLLDFSKIEAGKLALVPADFSLRAAVGDTLRALAVRAHRKGLELLCRVRPGVPDALDGDAGRLRQVLMNLVGNAIKFTPRGEVEVDVYLAPSSAASPVSLIFTVRDTGIGIALEKQAAIFRAFEQENSSTTRKYGGTGLGLTISAQLANLLGGEITVESAAGSGSTFRFTARFARSSRPEVPSVSPERLANLRVLAVDDNETHRRILDEWLTSWRMQPTAVGSADQALAALATAHAAGTPFALVLLDARMPNTDGAALAADIRRRSGPAAPRIILLGSDDDADLSARSRENGVQAYLLKPVQQAELLDAIRGVLDLDVVAPSAVAGSGGRPHGERALRVLVAEDNELNVALLQELLRRRGHHARFARDGRAALELAMQGTFDLLLLDLHMPELDGFEVVRAIRDNESGTGQHLPIIALTARSSARDRERCLAAGMGEFLSKPIEAAALWAAMERLVAGQLETGDPPTSVERGLLDPRAILRACGDQASVLETVRVVFRRSLPDQMSRVRAALADGDLVRLREAAHKLVGTVGTFSTVTADVASALEDAAEGQERASCAALVERLGALCDALLDATATLSIDSLSLQ